jgi:hypothetical protein
MVDGSGTFLLKTHGSDFKILKMLRADGGLTRAINTKDPVETKSVLSRVIEDIHQLSGHSLHDATGVDPKDPPVRGHDVP